MLWEKKPVTVNRPVQARTQTPTPIPAPEQVALVNPVEEKIMVEPARPSAVVPADAGQTQLGRSMVVKGDLSGSEDLTIAGQFDCTVSIQGNCLTIGPQGQVKGEISAARVVIHGTVLGNITVKERVEIYKSGHVVGDLIAPGISIEDGAYFKGKIEILRDGMAEAGRPLSSESLNRTTALSVHSAT